MSHTSILVDIDSGTVGGAVVTFGSDAFPEILYSTRKHIPQTEHPTSSTLTAAMIATLDVLLCELIQCGASRTHKALKIHDIHFVLASPWILTSVQHLTVAKNAPFLVTNDMIARIATGHAPRTAMIVENSILHVSLDGKDVADPQRQRASKVTVTVCSSETSKELSDALADTASKYIHIARAQIHSCTLLSYYALRGMLKTPHASALYIDVHTGITDISVITKGVLTATASIPVGTAAYISYISKSLSISSTLAESYISLYLKKSLHTPDRTRVRTALEHVHMRWTESLTQALASIGITKPTSLDVYVASSEGLTEFFTTFFNSHPIATRHTDRSLLGHAHAIQNITKHLI